MRPTLQVTAFVVFLLCASFALAATYTDTLSADFNLGNTSEVNVSSDTIYLPLASGAYNASGTFESRIFDLGSNPSASIAWNFATPSGTSLLVSSRSGPDATVTSNWSSWSSSYATSTGSTISSPRRYVQYRAILTTTDNTTTPSVTDVTLTYTQANTSVTSVGSNLTSSTSGSYNFIVNISDTFTVELVTAALSISNSTSTTQSSAVNLTASSGLYNLSIAEPTDWYAYANRTLTLYLNVTVSNGTVNITRNLNATELVDFVNSAPTIDPVSNQSLLQNATINVTLTASDVDPLTPSLTFTTNRSDITITSITSTSAYLTWTVGPEDVGTHVVTVTVNDTLATDETTFTVDVTDVNDAPAFESVDDFTGYYGIRILLTLIASDDDTSQELNFSVDPPFFTITAEAGNSSGERYGVANFTPAYPERGVHNLTFFVTDGYETANTSTVMTIEYCGDAVCQSTYEDTDTCRADCPAAVNEKIALVIPDRNCVNQPMYMYAFNATNRFSCYYQGLVEEGFALCEGIDSVSITAYLRNGTRLQSLATLSSGSNGSATYVPTIAGEYKFSATKEDFDNTSAIVLVRDCTSDIVVREQNVTVEQPTRPPKQSEQAPPEEELPGITQEEAGIFVILLLYVLAPLLAAALLYTSIVFYDVNKESLPWLLQLRIWLLEKERQYAPQIVWLQTKTAPVLVPLGEALGELWHRIKPLVDGIRDRLNKLRGKPPA